MEPDAPSWSGYWFRAPAELAQMMTLSSAELRVFLAVLHSLQQDQNAGQLSVREVARRAHLSITASQRALRQLVKVGFVRDERQHCKSLSEKTDLSKDQATELESLRKSLKKAIRGTSLFTCPITWRERHEREGDIDRTTQLNSGHGDRTTQLHSGEEDCATEANGSVPKTPTDLYHPIEQTLESLESENKKPPSHIQNNRQREYLRLIQGGLSGAEAVRRIREGAG
jgi:predicted transcriptional regulator